MFLRSIDIAGFKSFAGSTRLELAPGITALVGANGSGKSNVVDAVRWCLGEQSMRDLRGQRAEDVIYAGSRRVLGAAEVACTFEDAQGRGEWPWSEICIARRLYRSGDSEYLLNRERVRLRDVLNALRTLGIDGARYVVVTQGMADALLSATPLERRGLLEQAAGLSTYRSQREEAGAKLTTAGRNVETIEVVLAEMEPRLKLLRRQTRAEQDRKEAAARLRRRLTEWYAWLHADLERRRAEAAREVQSASEARGLGRARLDHLEDEAEVAVERERGWHRDVELAASLFHVAERQRDDLRHEVTRLETERSRLHSAHRELARRGEQVRLSREVAAQRFAQTERNLAALRSEQNQAAQLYADAENQRRQMHATVSAREGELSAAHEAYEIVRRECDALQRDLEERRNDTESAVRRSRDVEERRTALQAEQSAAALELSSLAEALEAATSAEKAAETELERVEAELQQFEVRHRRLSSAAERLRQRLSATSRKLTAARRELQALAAEAERGLGQLAVPPGWERATAAVLAGWQGESVDWPDSAVQAYLDWRATLAPHLGKARWADDLFGGSAGHHITPLHAAILVDSWSDAQLTWQAIASLPAHTVGSPAIRVVARSGHVWDALSSGRLQGDGRTARYLETRAEIAALERAAEVWETRMHGIEGAQRLLPLEERRADVGRRRQAVESGKRQSAELAEARERLGRRRAALHDEERQLSAAAARLSDELTRLTALRGRQEAALTEASRRAEKAAAALQAIRQETQQQRDQAASLQDQAAAQERRLDVLQVKVEAESAAREAARRELDRLDREALALAGQAEQTAAGVQRVEDELESRRAALGEAEDEREDQEERMAAVRAARPAPGPSPAELRQAHEQLAAAISRHERALMTMTQLEVERKQLADDVHHDLDLAVEELPSPPSEPPSEDEIRRLRVRANREVDADPSLADEYRELEERYRTLREHLEDLQSTSVTLRDIMATADREMRRRFDRALAAVNDEFSSVFRTMFGGGVARLEQVSDDGGIEVRAELPGRRARSSASFSGGERSLVASSLLFGVLRIRPTPFCILDEVDAALDEANVDRYLDVLRDISKRTQIVVVTHNRATMAAADVLYGMTMDDDGASRVLSLRLDAYEPAV